MLRSVSLFGKVQIFPYSLSSAGSAIPGPIKRPGDGAEIDEGVKARIIELSLEHPAFSQQRISDQLALEGVSACPTTLRNVWLKDGMETRCKRLLRLEETAAGNDIELTEQQIRLIEKANPEFRERRVESAHSGCLLCQDAFYVGRLKGVGRIYLQAVVDTYGSVHLASSMPASARKQRQTRALPFYEAHGLAVEAVLTDNGTEYKERPMIHLYEIFLEFNDIKHRNTKVEDPKTNGFAERFNRTVLDEFFRTAFRKKF